MHEIKKWATMCMMLLTALSLSAKPIVHIARADVRLDADYISMTHILDITPQDADEFRIPVEGKYLHKKCILYVDLLGRDGHFERLEWWDPTQSAAEKQFKCGRMWKDADIAELCWGLVPGKRNTYYITYPLVKALYSDGEHDILDYDFINLDKSCPAGQAEVKIYLKDDKKIAPTDIDLTQSTAEGDIQLRDGVLFITPKADAKGITSMNVHLVFRPGLFQGIPMRQANHSGNAGGQASNNPAPFSTGVPSPIQADELHSAMMGDTTPKEESSQLALFEYIAAYPKTSAVIGCLLFILGGLLFRFIKASRL